MKTYIYYIVFLLAAFVQSLPAQDVPLTKAQPSFPALPYTVTYDNAPTGGTVKLSISPDATPVTSGETVYSGTEVTLRVTPSAGDTDYEVVFGYPKVYYTNASSSIIPLTAVSGESGSYTFVMPKAPITVEVKFKVKPATQSSDARLKSLQYKIGSDQPGSWMLVPRFTAGTKKYDVTLPSSTADNAAITLSGQPADVHAIQSPDPAVLTLNGGSGTAALTVTAENNLTTETYTVHFTKAAVDKHVVTIQPVAGGTITVTDATTGKAIKSGDAVPENTRLTLTNTPVAGYGFSKYVAGGQNLFEETASVTVTSDLVISAEFHAPSDPVRPENIGMPAVAGNNPPVSATSAPVVRIPDAGSLPADTELSQLRLVKEDVEPSKEEQVKEDAKKAAAEAGIAITGNNMVLMEVTLVKVTTTVDGLTGKSETIVTPIQPADKVKVCIPYPSGVDKNSYEFTIIHIQSDGSIDVYSRAKGNLTLGNEYVEITVTGFSPFVVAYVAKSGTDPGTDPDPGTNPDPLPEPAPGFFTVTLPAVEGVASDPVAGDYLVQAGGTFCFFLTLDKDYDQSVPVVTTSRNETIAPFGDTNAYFIEGIQSAVTVTISGIRKNAVVSNATMEAGLRIRTETSALYVDTDSPADIRIVSLGGSPIASFEAQPGTTCCSLSPGIYIVKAKDRVYKIIIK